jgi:L-ribulose-5-phosphate 4-epimerase
VLNELRQAVCDANKALVAHGLVTLTWGNVSGIDRDKALVAIKPSGIDYDAMTADDIVLVDLEGRVVEGDLRPSSDTPTHLYLYNRFAQIGSITHTHSLHATMFAQARMEIACMGTTHADHFNGPVPVTRALTAGEVANAYELNTGVVIGERFACLSPLEMPAVLVAGHAPFTWGKNAGDSVKNAVALEAVARMALGCLQLRSDAAVLEDYVLNKHYERKHGPNAYYGQAAIK